MNKIPILDIRLFTARVFRATLVLGFLPQEMLGTSMYEYYHNDDIPALADRHKMALQINDYVATNIYR